MVYGIYLSLDQLIWYRDNYSSDDKLTGTIYTDINRTSSKNLTGYTLTLRMSGIRGRQRAGDRFGKTADVVIAANGTWSYAVGEGDMPFRGLYYFTVELAKTGTRETTLNRVEFQILDGPNS